MKKKYKKIYLEHLSLKNKRLFKSLYKKNFLELSDKKSLNQKLIEKILKKFFLKKEKVKFLIYTDNNIIGFLIVNFIKNIYEENVCYVNDFYIMKEFRKNGYATDVINKFIKELKKKHIKELRLEILNKNYLAKKFWNQFKLYKKSTNYFIKVR